MTVASAVNPQFYDGNGSQTVFIIPWTVRNTAWVEAGWFDADGVWRQKINGSDFTVALNGANWELTFNSAPPAGTKNVAIVRKTPGLQTVNFRDLRRFPADNTEAMGDRLAEAVQDLAAALNTVFRLAPTDFGKLAPMDPLSGAVGKFWTIVNDPDNPGGYKVSFSPSVAAVEATAAIAAEILTLAGISDEIVAVAEPSAAAAIAMVAPSIASVVTVANAIAAVGTVSFYIANVNTVAGSIANVNAVAPQILKVVICADNIADIVIAADNIAAIIAAPTQAAIASAKAAEAAAWSDADIDAPVEGVPGDKIVFDPATAVNLTTNVITLTNHGLSTDDQLRYRHGGGTAFAPLVHDTNVWAEYVDDNSIKLRAARYGAALDLTSIGTGNAHEFLPLRSAKHHAAYGKTDTERAEAAAFEAESAAASMAEIYLGAFANAAAAWADPDAAPGAIFDNTTDGKKYVLGLVAPAADLLAPPKATQAQAEAGTDDSAWTSSLNVAQAITARARSAPFTDAGAFYDTDTIEAAFAEIGGKHAPKTVDNKAALEALTLAATSSLKSVIVTDADYGGVFRRVTSDIQALVAADPAHALYVPFSGGNGSTGGFVRLITDGVINAKWYDALPSATAAVNGVALTRWLTAIAGKTGRIQGGVYNTDTVFQPLDGTTIIGGGCFMRHRSGYLYSKTNPTVIKGDGSTLTGANSTVGLFSKTAAGVAGSDFSAPDTDDLRDVTVIGGLHFDANGAQFASVYYRARDCDFGKISHSGAVVAGFGMWGCYGFVRPPSFGTFFNPGSSGHGHGFVIGEDIESTAYGSDDECYNIELNINTIGNGASSGYAKFTNDEVGSGGIIKAGRGSKIILSSETNTGRAFIVRGSQGLGSLRVEPKYIEGNGDGELYDAYTTTSTQITVAPHFAHPGNGAANRVYELADGTETFFDLTGAAGLGVNDIEVFLGGVKNTATTGYTVADNAGNLRVTIVAGAPAANTIVHIRAVNGSLKPQDKTIRASATDDGPNLSADWLVFENIEATPTNGTKTSGIVIHSNTYRYYLQRRDSDITFSHRPPTQRGAYASGFISWNATSVTHRTDAQDVGNITLSYIQTGLARLVFPPELVQYGEAGSPDAFQNYQLNLAVGQGTTMSLIAQVGSSTANSVELRLYDISVHTGALALANPSTAMTIKYTLTRIDQ